MHDRRLTHSSLVLTRRSTRRGGPGASSAGVAQLAEHLFCKQVVGGSSPPASSISLEGCPSGQREQAVNLPAQVYVGSNPTPSTRSVRSPRAESFRLLLRAVGRRRRPVGTGSVVLCAGRLAQALSSPRRPRRLFAVGSVSVDDRDLVFQDPIRRSGLRLHAGAAATVNEAGLPVGMGSASETQRSGHVGETGRRVGAFTEVRRSADGGGTSAGFPLRSFRGSSSIGRASAFQAERRGFESLLPLSVLGRCWTPVQQLNERIGWPT